MAHAGSLAAVRRPGRTLLAVLALVAAAGALWLGWRYAALARAVAARQQTLAASLAAPPDDVAPDASRRVALAIAANEGLFDEMVTLAEARRVAGWLCLSCAGVALGLGARAARRRGGGGRGT